MQFPYPNRRSFVNSLTNTSAAQPPHVPTPSQHDDCGHLLNSKILWSKVNNIMIKVNKGTRQNKQKPSPDTGQI